MVTWKIVRAPEALVIYIDQEVSVVDEIQGSLLPVDVQNYNHI